MCYLGNQEGVCICEYSAYTIHLNALMCCTVLGSEIECAYINIFINPYTWWTRALTYGEQEHIFICTGQEEHFYMLAWEIMCQAHVSASRTLVVFFTTLLDFCNINAALLFVMSFSWSTFCNILWMKCDGGGDVNGGGDGDDEYCVILLIIGLGEMLVYLLKVTLGEAHCHGCKQRHCIYATPVFHGDDNTFLIIVFRQYGYYCYRNISQFPPTLIFLLFFFLFFLQQWSPTPCPCPPLPRPYPRWRARRSSSPVRSAAPPPNTLTWPWAGTCVPLTTQLTQRPVTSSPSPGTLCCDPAARTVRGSPRVTWGWIRRALTHTGVWRFSFIQVIWGSFDQSIQNVQDFISHAFLCW